MVNAISYDGLVLTRQCLFLANCCVPLWFFFSSLSRVDLHNINAKLWIANLIILRSSLEENGSKIYLK